MADAVTAVTLKDGSKYVVRKLTNISDGTGESAVVKIDVSTLSPAATKLTIEEIWYDFYGMGAKLLFDANTDDLAIALQLSGHLDLRSIGGIPDPQSTGYTGDLLLTTFGHTAGDSYSIIIKCRKD